MRKRCEHARCRKDAAARVDYIVGDGGYGARATKYLCGEHLTELAVSTDRRYEVHEIVRARPRDISSDEQLKWC